MFFKIIRKAYKCNGYIVLYDVTVEESFKEAESIIKENIIPYLHDEKYTYKIPLYLVGNKIENFERRVIFEEEGEELANRYGFKYFEISVYNNIKINELMYSITIDYFMNFVNVMDNLQLDNEKNEKNIKQIKNKNKNNSENKNKINKNKKNQKNCIIF